MILKIVINVVSSVVYNPLLTEDRRHYKEARKEEVEMVGVSGECFSLVPLAYGANLLTANIEHTD